jgi:murein DD-endopeptidase MepM/ murein hydrolase activator NlpD
VNRIGVAVRCWGVFGATWLAVNAHADPFALPTANRALFEPGGQERYFVGTTGRSWESGTFGGVRSDGYQLHEGVDIRCIQRDKHGEPADPILASADGSVAYINRKASLSNYGIYIILQHRIDGIEVYTTYAHLGEVRSDLQAGTPVKAGEAVAVMGRTANTAEGISKDRAHVHFEIGLLLNDHFAQWYRQHDPDQRNDHGNWNGQALRGLDPREILLRSHEEGDRFSLTRYIRNQTELCRVQVRDLGFSWLHRYPTLVARNPRAELEGVAGYEISFNYVGLPYRMTPLTAAELKGKSRVNLVAVNVEEQAKNPCGKLVTQRSGQWELTATGQNLISLLTF